MTLLIVIGLIWLVDSQTITSSQADELEKLLIEPTATVTPAEWAQGLAGPYLVTRVVDGDTLYVKIEDEDVDVRLIGVDTPETVDPRKKVECFGEQASAFAKQMLTGRQVYLEYDESQGRQDRYGRVLAYVWLDEDQIFNELLLLSGYASEYTYDSEYRYHEIFKRAADEAEANGRGLWGACR